MPYPRVQREEVICAQLRKCDWEHVNAEAKGDAEEAQRVCQEKQRLREELRKLRGGAGSHTSVQ